MLIGYQHTKKSEEAYRSKPAPLGLFAGGDGDEGECGFFVAHSGIGFL